MTLEWHYDKGCLDVSMPGYVKEALHQLQHRAPSKPVHAPHQWKVIQYGETNSSQMKMRHHQNWDQAERNTSNESQESFDITQEQ